MTHDELRKLAEAATPGPWEVNKHTKTVVQFLGGMEGGFDVRNCPKAVDLAAYIAAANPKTVLELLDRIAELEGAEQRGRMAGLEGAHNWHHTTANEREGFAMSLPEGDIDREKLMHEAGLHRASADVMKILANGAVVRAMVRP